MKTIIAITLFALLACSEAKEQEPVPEAFTGCFTGAARGYQGFSGEVGGSPGLGVKQRSCE